jgi:hypothetical protein
MKAKTHSLFVMQLQDVGHVSCICCTVLRNTLADSHSTRYTDTLRSCPASIPDQSMKDVWWVKCCWVRLRISPAALVFP